jgi:hypothetical protein
MGDGKIDLFPENVLQKIADEGTNFPPAPVDQAEATRRETLGPLYGALTFPPGAPGDLSSHLEAEGALSLLPAALLGPLLKPAVDGAYSIIDHIPEAIRRPFEKDFGLLIDNVLSFLGDATFPLVDQTLDKFAPDGAGLPQQMQLDIQGFSQVNNSCGETAAATILKAAGTPVALGDIDTQLSGFDGTTGQLGQELRRHGATVVSGPGDLAKLRTFVAAGMPVLVQVGWASGGGHFAVVSGYDDAKKQLTIRSFDGEGGTNQVSYDEFESDWARAYHSYAVVLPRRDPRLDGLAAAGDLRRPTPIYEGLSLSDFWVTGQGKVYIEGAYRYVSKKTDVTVRVGYDSSETGLSRQLGGSIAYKQCLAPGWFVGFTVEKMSLLGQADDWHSFTSAPISLYGTLQGPGFVLTAGEERGGYQASIAADLGKLVAGMGLQANVVVNPDGSYRVSATLAGTF